MDLKWSKSIINKAKLSSWRFARSMACAMPRLNSARLGKLVRLSWYAMYSIWLRYSLTAVMSLASAKAPVTFLLLSNSGTKRIKNTTCLPSKVQLNSNVSICPVCITALKRASNSSAFMPVAVAYQYSSGVLPNIGSIGWPKRRMQ